MPRDADAHWPVAVVGPFHPYRGGIAHHTTLLAGTLATAHPVLGVNFTRLYPGFFFPGRTQLDDSGAPLQATGVEVVRVVDSLSPRSWLRAAAAIRRFGARLVIVQWWHPFFAPAYATIARRAKRGGARVVYLCHNVLPHEPSRLATGLVRVGLGAADAFLVQSQTDLQELERLYPARPRLLSPHPAYTFFATGRQTRAAAREELQVDGPVVLFFGLIRAYKGLDVLLRAVARVRERVPVTLLVAGEFYQDRGPYEQLIQDLGIRAAVHLVDRYIPNEAVETYFHAADVVVLPYVSATQSGIAQIALSFERPVVVTRVGGLPEAVREGETGFVVPPSDPEALARTLIEFFTTDGAARLQPHLRGEAERFSWTAMLAAVHRIGAGLGLPTP